VDYHWSIHQLTEYFEAVTSQDDEWVAIRGAVERAVEGLGAELGVMIRDDQVVACVGLGRAAPAVEAISPAIHGAAVIDVPPLGLLHSVAAWLDDDAREYLVISRIDNEFSGEERQLLQGMARVLGLALRSLRALQIERTLRTERELEAAERLRLLDTLGSRQRLLESMLTIQRAISHRAPSQTVLDAVTAGASQLLDGAFLALVIASPVDGQHRVVSASTPAWDGADYTALVIATAAQAVANDQLVTRTDDDGSATRYTALAAPVHIEGQAAGSLVTVASSDDANVDDWRATLTAFAEQASVALTDARTVEAMRDAYQDPLTGLPNRALFMDRLNHSLQVAARQGTQVTVLFIDLDRFKDVNDSLGHAAGDELLAWFSRRIRESVRGEDTAARLGGDEFAILLEHTVGDSAGRAVANRLSRALREPLRLADRELFVSASVGIAWSGDGAGTADELLRNADIAMYRAKRTGGGDALVYEPTMHTEAIDGLELGPDLYHAASRGELRLEFQPIIDLLNGAAVGVEALVRWEHATRGLIQPNVFIPLAERNGVITEIGEWVLRNGCTAAAAWRATSTPDLRVSINVSARQLDDPAFADLVAAVLAETRLPASALTLEITESVLMRDPERAIDRIRPLKALGVRLAIDDFGTGFSSLAYLQRLPADELKIDKVFIDAIETSVEGSAIVRTVAELARTLNMQTVAEGIETRRQHEILRTLCCDLGQGYHFARPLKAEAVPGFFAAAQRPTRPAARARGNRDAHGPLPAPSATVA
jgi:diguanylate cyclase (GGDEF)-like protein